MWHCFCRSESGSSLDWWLWLPVSHDIAVKLLTECGHLKTASPPTLSHRCPLLASYNSHLSYQASSPSVLTLLSTTRPFTSQGELGKRKTQPRSPCLKSTHGFPRLLAWSIKKTRTTTTKRCRGSSGPAPADVPCPPCSLWSMPSFFKTLLGAKLRLIWGSARIRPPLMDSTQTHLPHTFM